MSVSSRCRHQLADLSKGTLDKDGCLVCPWHGFDFDLDTGRCNVDEGLAIPVYPARVTGDVVEVDLP